VEDQDGKELKKADDSAGADPILDWTASADGKYLLAVGNLLHRGGTGYVYRVSARRSPPEVRGRLAANVLVLEAGKTNEIKLNVKFSHGAKGQWSANARGLPPDIQAAAVDVPEKGGDVSLKLAAGVDAKSFNGPIEIWLREKDGTEQRAISDLVATGVDNGVPNGFNRLILESVDHLWLTVRPVKAATNVTARVEPPKS
jgi:hypothetical protein